MLTKQFLVTCHKQDHPNANFLNANPPRNIRKTARNYIPEVSEILQGDTDIEEHLYHTAIKSIHTNTVSNLIDRYAVNKVLGTKPPLIPLDEAYLPRPSNFTYER